MSDQLEEVHDVVEEASEVFAGRKPDIVSAALADLLALLIVGHIHEDGIHKTRRLRARLLHSHIQTVHKLIDYYSRRDDT